MNAITGKTAVYGVIGDPIAHSLSPLMHNRALEIMDIDAVYAAFHVIPDNLGDAISGLRALGIRGLNVTVPHKMAVMSYLDEVSEDARAIGAVNTIIVEDDRLVGDNTDAYGFLMCVLKGAGLEKLPATVCVLGAGGASRGVVYALAERGEVERIAVANRTVSKAERLASELSTVTGKVIDVCSAEGAAFHDALASAELVVNTTTVGMHPDQDLTPVADPAVFHPGQIVCDIIYSPLETRFLREAAAYGAKTINGLAMLAYQGARSLSLWTKRDAPAETMLAVLRERMEMA